MSFSEWKRPLATVCLAIMLGLVLTGCSDDDSFDDDGGGGDNGGDLTSSQINDTDGTLSATLRYTTGGVPHITADNLESAGFGSGYAQAQANVCLIADTILQVRSQRARFYGPGPGNINVITDFSIKALGLMDKAKTEFDTLPATSQAMLRGFVAGYNKYVAETDPAELPGKCQGQPWVRAITPQQLYGYYRLIALYGSGYLFITGATFAAAPPGAQVQPVSVTTTGMRPADQRILAALDANTRYRIPTDFTDYSMGSNGWGIGSELTENGRGALLANPHYPYTGNRRFYQQHLTVPGVYDVNGGSLIGFVLPQIGFNRNVAWTHTVTTANHFTFYKLQLAAGDNLTYIKDGEAVPITSKTFQIQVGTGTGTPLTLEKTFYYSEYGPIINANAVSGGALPAWGGTGPEGNAVAFTYRDAGAAARDFVGVEQYLQMGRASNLAEFKAAFQPCGNVIFVNTMYADADGNAFYIDGSAVPKLSPAALTAFQGRVAASPVVAGLAASGIVLLDGSTSRDDWVEGQCNGLVGYEGFPKLTRTDYVQNSNDSYWATNLDTLDDVVAAGYSPLFGPVNDPLSPRTRMGLKMITNRTDAGLSGIKPAGADGLFTGKEIIEMLYSNRAYYPETLLDDLLARCEALGADPVELGGGASRSVEQGCNVLKTWDGVYNTDSTGAHVFRVFIGHYDDRLPEAFTVPFDPASPATTPSTPPEPANLSQDPMLQALAQGLEALDTAGIAYNAALGTVQYQQQSGGVPPGGTAVEQGAPIPWHGNQNVEGGFNIVRPYISDVDDGSRFPRVSPDESDILPNTGNLSAQPGEEGWRIAYGTSWHFGLMFTDAGPEAWGLISYSQSDDPSSPHFSDQDQRYSDENYRELLYSEQEIASDPNLETMTITAEDPFDSNS